MSLPPQANSQATPSHSQLFTMRVWTEAGEDGQVAWRFKVQHVLSGEARYCNDWQTVVEFMVSHNTLVE